MSSIINEYSTKYSFDLPEELIARFPQKTRAVSRLLLVDREKGTYTDHQFTDLLEMIREKDVVILNTTRVSKRRVVLRRKTGGLLPTLFLRVLENGEWACLVKGSGKLKVGERILPLNEQTPLEFIFTGHIDMEKSEGALDEPVVYLKPVIKETTQEMLAWKSSEAAERFFEQWGEPPIPPYLKRTAKAIDSERYQTVYAKHPGSVAAPTAGFHFEDSLIKQLQNKGAIFAEIELQIGYGTFAPLAEKNFVQKKLHREQYRITERNVALLQSATKRKVSVGTTTLRALEANYRENNEDFRAGEYETSIFIYPPDQIKSVDCLLTNFHLPKSSLFLLVCAFAGRELMQAAYRHAIEQKYRFYSYGDAMLII